MKHYELYGLKEEEYERIVQRLGREPNEVELGILGALWSEHCSYKSSRVHLRKFPTSANWVIQGPGENAGVVELDSKVWLAFKVESHNHPSYIEPFHGAATGVGGIIRDVLSMGARPIALVDSLRFGLPIDKRIVKGVVSGISHYGNCIGIPTVAGETYFEECYRTNPLVNAFCLGILPAGRMLRARGKPGDLLFLLGSATGRDGIHGAVMASAEFGEGAEEKLPNVQIGDPYFGKKLIEAVLQVIEEGLITGLQDLGAAGLSGASSELASKSKCGVELWLEKVPLREEGMKPFEILLSESQERMLLITQEDKLQRLLELANYYHLEGAVVGRLTEDGMFRAYYEGKTVAELPASLIVEEAPVYEKPYSEPAYLKTLWSFNQEELPQIDLREALLKLLSSPNIASKEWIYTQYDHQVGTNTVLKPGGDSAILRVKWVQKPELRSEKLIAITSEGNGRMFFLDPYEGGKYAVAEALRNLACVGAKPLGITDCLNFGNPDRPEVMWQLVKAIEGISDACRFFEVPVISGNVSLYNETVEREEIRNIYPTPILVAVGYIDSGRWVDHRFKEEGDLIFLVGDLKREFSLAGSEYLKVVHGKVAGRTPQVNLEKEKKLHALLIRLIEKGLLRSAHDVSVGGLAIALLESTFETGLGIDINLYVEDRLDFFLFSENPTLVVVSLKKEDAEAFKDLVEEYGLDWMFLGKVKEGRSFTLTNNDESLLELPLEELEELWKRALERLL
ncbi:phosphoribosylformylglycinamidine synthase subunit PurL [Hydrogenobacter sp. T-2]|uniref:phosphoribosylformylglycinamidine synthase subunit PurL n=1 Tax=Pampinifervens diazotrophicum TaxID=1632018 RepID=UPI002B25DBE5|nr:phosphoribosylformylglycinamidine synthase subunit PurL [Hydrogenobacter sp. T-2]WPM31207.1 phosphoribosylformylglycinamidine synthase subunit PurL [Hydrogenobacter sp. T-2]